MLLSSIFERRPKSRKSLRCLDCYHFVHRTHTQGYCLVYGGLFDLRTQMNCHHFESLPKDLRDNNQLKEHNLFQRIWKKIRKNSV